MQQFESLIKVTLVKHEHPTMPFMHLTLVRYKISDLCDYAFKLLHLLLYTIFEFCAEKNRCIFYNDSLLFLERMEVLTEPATISIMVAGGRT
ncbi:hypothetical protein IKE82_01350 [Candidatus Saccharibacteria bacterium]|nr:hypothetical protein [Candidatus Saccharibacteria bacterium]